MIRRKSTHHDALTVTKETDQMTAPTRSFSSNRRPTRRVSAGVGLIGAIVALLALAAVAQAKPAWKLTVASNPTNFSPNVAPTGFGSVYLIVATNIGDTATTSPITVTDSLPVGLTPGVAQCTTSAPETSACGCETSGLTVTCTEIETVHPGDFLTVSLRVKADSLPDPTILTNSVTISGGGASTVQASTTTPVSNTIAPFDFIPGASGLSASLTGPDGLPVTQAGSHPSQFTFDLALPSRKPGPFSLGGVDGGIRDLSTTLPRGAIVNPLATPIRCTEAQLESYTCPDASAVGLITITTVVGGVVPVLSPLYMMEPPPGEAAQLGFDAVNVGIFVHIDGGVRSGDYALSADTNDILAKPFNPLLSAQVQLWGDPSSPSYEEVRGNCAAVSVKKKCFVTPQTTPLLTMPTSCPDETTVDVSMDSWGHPGEFHEKSVPLTDSNGNATPVSGCGALQFEPSLQARPTTNVADAPSGLSVDLKVPQTNNLKTLATAHLKKADVTLPEGLVINPASANGLAGCSSAQVGIDPATGVPNGNDVSCPDASRIGSVEVDTPLLENPLQGSVFVATPKDNPFDSLLAIYVVVYDPQSGVLVKLPGHVIPDPNTGRLRTVFDENPQLPFSSFQLEFFGGATAPLRTPATCGTYSTTSQMTPWSAPDSGPPATPSDTYAISQGPGGACASNVNALPNNPSFDAGTVSPIAGQYSPFVFNLRRDGRHPAVLGGKRHPAPRPGRQARRHPLLPRGGAGCSCLQERQPGEGKSLLSRRLQGRHRLGRRRSRPGPLLRTGHRLPRRPLQGRPAEHGDRHPGRRRSL